MAKAESDSVEMIPLEDRLCFALYAASRAMTARYRAPLTRLGLTYPQFLVMLALWQDGARSVSQIGQQLSLDSSTLSPLIKRLETVGLVSRSRDPLDERSVVVALTAAGRALRRKAPVVTEQMLAAAGMASSDQIDLARQLRALARHLGADLPD